MSSLRAWARRASAKSTSATSSCSRTVDNGPAAMRPYGIGQNRGAPELGAVALADLRGAGDEHLAQIGLHQRALGVGDQLALGVLAPVEAADPSSRHADQVRAAQRQHPHDLHEAQVVADAQSDGAPGRLGHGQAGVAGSEAVLLDVEEVKLAVVGRPRRRSRPPPRCCRSSSPRALAQAHQRSARRGEPPRPASR